MRDLTELPKIIQLKKVSELLWLHLFSELLGWRPSKDSCVSRCTTLNVFRDNAAGALPAIWAKLPQTLVLRGEDKGWRKIAKQCKNFLIGRKPKIRKNTQSKEQKMIVIEQLAVSNPTILNQELNWGSTDWNKEADLIKCLLSQPIKCND